MAAGVPVVVSDWDGYRYTVTDGLKVFVFPTLAPAALSKERSLPSNMTMVFVSYQDYVGAVAQHVAVDTDAAALLSLVLLTTGFASVVWEMQVVKLFRQRFDWPVVARLHHQLYADLAERRRSGSRRFIYGASASATCGSFPRFRFLCDDMASPETELRLALPLLKFNTGSTTSPAWIALMSICTPTPSDLQRLLGNSRTKALVLLELSLAHGPPISMIVLSLSITWLAKLGFIEWSQPIN